MIHPSSIVSPLANLASTVEVGPFCMIGEHVSIGQHTKIGVGTVVEGYTTIGAHNNIGHHSVIGGRPQDMKYADEPTQLIIGDYNTIREYVTIHTGTSQANGVTKIGNHNWIMSYVHIAHDCILANHTILSSNAQLAGHVEVDDYAIIGGMSGIHQFVRIGKHSMLGGASSLVQDIAPYIMAAGQKAIPHGINQVGLSRRGFSEDVIKSLKKAYKLVYNEGLMLKDAKLAIAELIAQLAEKQQDTSALQEFLSFIEASKRGLIRE